jgi:tripartite-type tricarboxylate transporter receptor subunit TctC
MHRRSQCQQIQARPVLAFVTWIVVQFVIMAVISSLSAQRAIAQITDYPNRSVRIVLPLPPGAANDATLRLIAERLSRQWGQPVIVDNKPGASTIIGTEAVVRAPADGYTLLATISLIAQNHVLRKKLPYDALRDLTPVTQINRPQLVLYVRGNLPIQNIAELVSYAAKHSGQLNFGTWGLGSAAHLILEKFRVDKGVQMTHVPYRGAADITNAVVAGQVDLGVGELLSTRQFFETGQLRAIGVTGPSRVSILPNAETLAEAGVQGFESYSWFGLFAPANTPPQIVRKISDAINGVQSDPALAKRLAEEMFAPPAFTTPEEFAKSFQQEIAKWGSVIAATGVTIEE